MKVTFLGAAREVTGSCYFFETATARFVVDCGMHQGGREASARNRQPFGFDPRTLDFVLLTHAHIDHSGLLPKLMREGFGGPIHTTAATADLLGVMLPDSGHIQEMDAQRAARRRKSAKDRSSATPLYTVQDAQDSLKLLRPVPYDERVDVHAGLACRFRDAGHILGSAIIEIWITEDGSTTKLVMSGDLGQPGRAILRDPVRIEEADILFIESTYGDRLHKDMPATLDELVEVIDKTLRQGNVIVPAFAVGRTQELLYHLHRLTQQGRLNGLQVFVDSPMATAATEITMRHMALFDEEARKLSDWHTAHQGQPGLRFTGSVEESIALNRVREGAIVISASGMCNAGRIKHHLRHNLPRPECAVLITGFQAQGTLGRQLVDGATHVGIFGEEIPVRASIHTLGGFSAHADQAALLAWADGFARPPRKTFVVHGEATAALALAERLSTDLGWAAQVPELGTTVAL